MLEDIAHLLNACRGNNVVIFENTHITTIDNRRIMLDGEMTVSDSHIEDVTTLNDFFQRLRLTNPNQEAGYDKAAKIGQILSYLEVLHGQVRKYSKKRELVFIDSGAGNCYLSFLVYFFYSEIDGRPVRIHCLDNNQRLMEKNRQLAETFGFERMFFHACDIADYEHVGRPDAVYSLHACDTATDKTLFLGLRTHAKNILSVSCCQHTLIKKMRSYAYAGITQHRVFRERLAYMVGDSLRALLLEMQGYEVEIIEFTASRHTGKNIMLRARKGQTKNLDALLEQYFSLQKTFHVKPALEYYLSQEQDNPRFSVPLTFCLGAK